MDKTYILSEQQIRQIFVDGEVSQYKEYDPNEWSNYLKSRCGDPVQEREGWISVKDRLPAPDWQINVLIQYPNQEPLVICGYYTEGEFFCLEEQEVLDYVTHWQPLPLPPSNQH